MFCPLCNDGVDYGDQLLQHYESTHAEGGSISTPAIEALEKRIDALFERHLKVSENSARIALPPALVTRPASLQRQSVYLKRLIQERDDLRNRLVDAQTELSAAQQRIEEVLRMNEELKRQVQRGNDRERSTTIQQLRGRRSVEDFVDRLLDEIDELRERNDALQRQLSGAEKVLRQPRRRRRQLPADAKPPLPPDDLRYARSIDSGIASTSESSTRASETYVTPRRVRVTVTRSHGELTGEQKVYNRWSLSTKDDYHAHEHSPDNNYEAVDVDSASINIPAIVAPMPPTESDDALILIFERLDSIDLLSCARVCRRWHQILMCRGDSVMRFWSNLSVKNKQVDNEQLTHLSEFATMAQSLNLHGLTCAVSTQNAPLRQKRARGVLENGLECVLRSCGLRLRFLKIADCSPFLTERALHLAACYNRELRHIIYSADERCSINAAVVWQAVVRRTLGSSCIRLQTLVAPAPPWSQSQAYDSLLGYDDQALLMVAKCFPHTLHTLAVGGQKITYEALNTLGRHLRHLHTLQLNDCAPMAREAAELLLSNGAFMALIQLTLIRTRLSANALQYLTERLSMRQCEIFISDHERLDMRVNDY